MAASRRSVSKKKFIQFLLIIFVGWAAGVFVSRRCLEFTPETFHAFILSLGLLGPAMYISIFIIRPFFLISSIALFIAGGLAFGPVWGPLFAAFGATIGGSLGFYFARAMGHEYIYGILKKKKSFIENQKFSFSIVLVLSLLPIMPVTIINMGAGLSDMKYRPYIIAHVLGLTPRAFAYGFFGSTLFATGTLKFKIALLLILVMVLLTTYFARKARQKS
ncbi:TVP38/TMEM64 family protein [Thermodesulfobacteriota bacterium]